MTIKMLVFDFRNSERNFFKTHDLEHFDITFYEEPLNEETVKNLPVEELEQTTVISVFISSDVNCNVLEKFKNLRIISTRSTGVDHISETAVLQKNICVVNVENYGSTSVAQYTFALILALIRKIIPAKKYLEYKNKKCEDFVGRDLSALTLGVVGTGAIGGSVCKLGVAFGMKILTYDFNEKQELIEKFKVKYVNFDTLIKQSDVISVHVPYTGENFHMFGKEEFFNMKDAAYFINTSRGEVVDTIAAYEALDSGKLAGLALDVVTCEDVSFECSETSFSKKKLSCVAEVETVKKLTKMENAIITPHIAYETQDAIDYILKVSFEGILSAIKGGYTYRVM